MTTADPDEVGPRPVPPPAIESSESSRDLKTVDPGNPPRRSIFRRVLRILVWLIVIAAIAVGVYFGWPVVYDRLVQPVEANTAEVGAIQTRLEHAEERLVQLEAAAATRQAAVDELTRDQADLAARTQAAEDLIAIHTERLDELGGLVAGLDAAVGDAEAEVVQELVMLRSMELLSRARLFLYQANYGLASQDLLAAREVLSDAEADETIEEALFRIDRSLDALPDRPVAAADDLDIAWQALLGVVQQVVAPPPTPSEEPNETSPTTAP